jgi:hypothetical protein
MDARESARDMTSGRPHEDFLMFSFESEEMSLDIYMMVEHQFFSAKATIEAWIKIHSTARSATVRRSAKIPYEYIMRSPLGANDTAIQYYIGAAMNGLVDRVWRAIASELPEFLRPGTFSVFAWEVANDSILEEIRGKI